jgi:hypothetical protein
MVAQTLILFLGGGVGIVYKDVDRKIKKTQQKLRKYQVFQIYSFPVHWTIFENLEVKKTNYFILFLPEVISAKGCGKKTGSSMGSLKKNCAVHNH